MSYNPHGIEFTFRQMEARLGDDGGVVVFPKKKFDFVRVRRSEAGFQGATG
jgi:hypothetical protein